MTWDLRLALLLTVDLRLENFPWVVSSLVRRAWPVNTLNLCYSFATFQTCFCISRWKLKVFVLFHVVSMFMCSHVFGLSVRLLCVAFAAMSRSIAVLSLFVGGRRVWLDWEDHQEPGCQIQDQGVNWPEKSNAELASDEEKVEVELSAVAEILKNIEDECIAKPETYENIAVWRWVPRCWHQEAADGWQFQELVI